MLPVDHWIATDRLDDVPVHAAGVPLVMQGDVAFNSY